MVYQQFINYPGMSVYDNIASPLRLMGKSQAEIDRAVRETAEMLRLTPMLAAQTAGAFGRPAAALRPWPARW